MAVTLDFGLGFCQRQFAGFSSSNNFASSASLTMRGVQDSWYVQLRGRRFNHIRTRTALASTCSNLICMCIIGEVSSFPKPLISILS
jgi:hypothetical protein